jgi:prepilin-type N-terminal cleavage/methylation domain-containing protein
MYCAHPKQGFSIIEILVVAAILGILATVSLQSFKSLYLNAVLRGGAGEVYDSLSLARTKTLASKDDTVYGVRVSSTTVTRFTGSAYVPGSATNQVYSFEGGVTATSSLLNTDIVFARFSGVSNATGTIYVRGAESTSTIRIHTSGLVEYD